VKRVSDKRKIENAQRKVLMLERFGPREEWRCEWWKFVIEDTPNIRCYGDVNGHEVLKTSRGGSRIDMGNIVLLCSVHNDAVEDLPEVATRMGLALHNWDPR
jgi:hypothetical protein